MALRVIAGPARNLIHNIWQAGPFTPNQGGEHD